MSLTLTGGSSLPSSSPPPSSTSAAAVIFSGGASGMCAQAGTWPLEFAKTLKQFPPPKNNPNPNVWQQFRHYKRTYGLWSVYRGLLPPITLAFPRASLRFQMYHTAEHTLKGSKLTPSEKFAAGVAAGCAESWLLMTPAEVIKVYCIEHKTTLPQTLREIYQSPHGVKGFWSGAMAMGAKQAVMQSVTYVTVDLWSSKSAAVFGAEHAASSKSVFIGGVLGGGLAVFFNNPFDVVRTRQQRLATCGGIGLVSTELYKESGFRGFYKGVGLRAMRMGLLQGCTFGLFSAATGAS